MTATQVHNWFGDITWQPAREFTPTSIDDVVRIVTDPTFPSPIRAVGSNHSTTACAAAPSGTTLFMTEMNAIVAIGPDTVTAQPGAAYIDVARALEGEGLQFYVNIELGDLTMGAAATVGTKEASFEGEHGQVSSYLASATIVTATGEVRTISEDEPELLQAFRSSYGLFGITCEVTFKVRPMAPLEVHHRVYTLERYLEALPALRVSGDSLMMYLDPMGDRIAVEMRRYGDVAEKQRYSRWQWRLRNTLWKDVGPLYAYLVRRFVPSRRVRDALLTLLSRVTFPILRHVIRGTRTRAGGQQIHYPPVANDCKYTFSIWAYPAHRYPDALRAYFAFCKDYEATTGFRVTLPSVGYRTGQDTEALLSYSFDEEAITIDPVTTPEPGWDLFLEAYAELAQQHGGIPLFNQTKHVTRDAALAAFGSRLDQLEQQRRSIDPDGRFLSPFFADLLQ